MGSSGVGGGRRGGGGEVMGMRRGRWTATESRTSLTKLKTGSHVTRH